MVGKRKTLGNHQRSFVWGHNLIAEVLSAETWIPLELLHRTDLDTELIGRIDAFGERHDVPVHSVSADRLTQLCGAKDHQGVIAKMPPFPYTEETSLLERSPNLLLVLDRIQDPHNFGAMLRSAEIFGIDGILIGQQHQTGVTSHVARASAGAVLHVPIVRSDSLPMSVELLRGAGLQVLAASEKATQPIDRVDLTRPTALIIGNEGDGVSPSLLELATEPVRIPQRGRLDSLNAAVATGILCYEVARQRVENA